ncbi:MAG: glycine zipper 2TM domain-containing protein, partial [Nevskiales bacterium]|nr:glycine zipper 2TM domain-containing protein [Nevskiales bacterium]
LVGGIIGGVIGHQFGKGHGQDAATIAGALIGASHAGRHHGRHVVERTAYATTCQTVHTVRYEERIEGYDVTYTYRGQIYHAQMSYDPGQRVRIRVEVTPHVVL